MRTIQNNQMTKVAREAIARTGHVHICAAWSKDGDSLSVEGLRKWLRTGRVVKIEAALKLARIVGVPPHEICPHVYSSYTYSPTKERKKA